ncbi:hypothetical protein ABC977_10350 [Thioalkalicoccus limnaeus]|uniref:Uncharacterized protein n=1 Tax=Thioalkalicoccus limnaeus TaxID=120681 RepID=A0ABV4BHK5_9GAMM
MGQVHEGAFGERAGGPFTVGVIAICGVSSGPASTASPSRRRGFDNNTTYLENV